MSDKQNTRPCWVGLDTSNYTTSAAACTTSEDGQITVIANCKAPLPVAEGARGLRQSDAVYAVRYSEETPWREAMDTEEVKSNFGLILSDWSTGMY